MKTGHQPRSVVDFATQHDSLRGAAHRVVHTPAIVTLSVTLKNHAAPNAKFSGFFSNVDRILCDERMGAQQYQGDSATRSRPETVSRAPKHRSVDHSLLAEPSILVE